MPLNIPASVLLIDDEPANFTALKAALGEVVENFFCATSEDALERLSRSDVAVILLAARSPDGDAIGIARRIRNEPHSQRTPIVFLTASGQDSFPLREAYALGAVDHLTEPVIREVLQAKVALFAELHRKSALLARNYTDSYAAPPGGKDRRVHLMLHNSRDYAFIMMDVDGRITEWEGDVETITGWQAAETVGEPLAFLFTPDDRAAGAPMTELQQAKETGRAEDRRWHVRKNGTHFVADGVVIALKDDNHQLHGFAKIFRDATTEHNATKRLQASEERLQATLASIGDGVIVADANGRVTMLNAVAENLTGWTHKDALDKPLQDVFQIVNEATRAKIINPGLRALSEGGIVGLPDNTVLIARDGKEYPIDDSAAPIRGPKDKAIGTVLVFRNITEKKALEREIHESRERFRTIVSQAATGVVQADAEGRMTLVNRKWCDMLGYAEAELLGKSIIDVTDPASVPSTLEQVGQLAAGRRADFVVEKQYRRKDGSTLWATSSVSALRSTAGDYQGLVAIVADMSERKQAEERLRESREQMALLLQSSGEGLYGLGLDSRCTFINSAGAAMLGYQPEELVGRQLHGVIHQRRSDGSAYPLSECKIYLAASTGVPVRVEDEVFWHRDGTPIPVAYSVHPIIVDGKVTGAVATFTDITERKKAENVLRESEEQFRSIATRTTLGIAQIDLTDRYVYVNQRYCELLGYSQEELLDRTMPSVTHRDDLEESMARVRKVRQDGIPYIIEKRYICKNGSVVWVNNSVSTVRDAQGNLVGTQAVAVDITENKALSRELEQSHELLSSLTQQAPGALYQFRREPDGRYSCPFISAMAEDIYELSPQAVIHDVSLIFERIHEEDREALLRSIEESAATLEPWHLDFRVRLPQQGVCWREGKSKPTRLEDGAIVWHGFITDISGRKRIERTIQEFNEALERRANYDALTGLPNRGLFRDRLDQEIRHAESGGQAIALLFLDLDRFKEINDVFGHDAGDILLVEAARRIQQLVRPADTVARLGGDEFTVILTQADELQRVEQVAQDILDALAQPFQVGDELVRVSGSIGITLYPIDARLPEDLIRNADQAMYLAKASGRSQLSFFKNSMQVAAMNRLRLIGELRGAVSKDELRLYFQPVVDVATGKIVKAEALVRWEHPGRGLMLPAEFISIAEETGLINEIGDWVFMEAASWSKRWSTRLGRPFQISVNKSPVQFAGGCSSLDWIAYLAQLGLARRSISIEITEGVLLNVSDAVSEKLAELQSGGIEVSIDDFGTGYSSMSYLKRLDIDYLKIDQSFVHDMLHDGTTATIAETIIVMAHKLELKVVAEGVESIDQRNWLRAHGCDYAQGYLFSQPLPPSDFERLLFSENLPAALRNSPAESSRRL
jgi:diguanylate cyclase (GGDEF)-like protein/PAS domain S-box-containing protein